MADGEAFDSEIRRIFDLEEEVIDDLLRAVGFARGRVAGYQNKLLLG